jgi:hypothetical protein
VLKTRKEQLELSNGGIELSPILQSAQTLNTRAAVLPCRSREGRERLIGDPGKVERGGVWRAKSISWQLAGAGGLSYLG